MKRTIRKVAALFVAGAVMFSLAGPANAVVVESPFPIPGWDCVPVTGDTWLCTSKAEKTDPNPGG